MKYNFNLKRIRREVPNPKYFLRVHRGEFGHNYKKKIDLDSYYADTESLIHSLKKNLKIKSYQNIVLGNGAESLIRDTMMWHSSINKKKNILIYDPNYFMYEHFAKLYGYRIFKFKLKLNTSYYINYLKIIEFIKKNNINILSLVNPSAPLEKKIDEISLIKLLRFCNKKKIIIMLDEVYESFYQKHSFNLVNQYKNLIVIRTFSKMAGYPGLKVGFAICGKKIFKALNSCRLSVELPRYVVDQCKKILKSNVIKENERIITNSIVWGNKNFSKIGIKSLTKSTIWFTINLNNQKIKKKVLYQFSKKKILVNKHFKSELKNLISFTVSHLSNIKYIFNVIKNSLK